MTNTANLLLNVRLPIDTDCGAIERVINELNDASWKYIRAQTPAKGIRGASEIDNSCLEVIERYLPLLRDVLGLTALETDEVSMFIGANVTSKRGELALMWQLIPNAETRATNVSALFRKCGIVSISASLLGDDGVQQLQV